jgi:hypothetical protein
MRTVTGSNDPNTPGLGEQMPIQKSISIIVATAIAYFLLFRLNTILFSPLGYSAGVDWIFLPSGLRLAFVMIFVGLGAVGIAVASIAISLMYYFNGDVVTAVGAGLISGFAPWLARLICLDWFELDVNLYQLSASTLLKVSVVFALFSPLLHQLWFTWRGQTEDFISSTAVMTVGDLAGTMVVLYAGKFLLNFVSVPGKT